MSPPIPKVPTKAQPNQAKRATIAMVLALTIAKPAEGLYHVAYYDPPGILTVCYGTTGPEVVKGKRYTLAECDAFINDDMRAAIAEVEACAPGLPVPVLAAFADAVYNLGGRIACDKKSSTAARYLAAGKLVEACNQLPRWNKASVMGVMTPLRGLTKRRTDERNLCLQGAA
jgi:GH24 family phage-related lysozyme (muramidase)